MNVLARTIGSRLLSVEGLILLLLVAGVLASLSKRRARLSQPLLMLGAILSLVVLLTPVPDILIATLEHPFPPLLKVSPDRDIETIVVLSGEAWYHPGLPIEEDLEAETCKRILEGIRLYNQRRDLKLLISGGSRVGAGQQVPVASVIADFARTFGVPAGSILVEDKSQNTYENLVEVKRILGAKKFILVTSAYHLPRAMAVAHKLQMNPIPAPAWISGSSGQYRTGSIHLIWSWETVRMFGAPDSERFVLLDRALHELVGYAWYWTRGRL